MSKVLVINCGIGNLGSVRRAFEECGAHVLVSDNPDDLRQVDRIVLPGVGAYADGMEALTAKGWPEPLRDALEKPGVALIGICLGMQLLSESGTEGGGAQGLGLIPGKVVRLEPGNGERIPHVGWNELQVNNDSPLMAGIHKGTDFYFVHSYHFLADEDESIVARTSYCGSFVSVVGSGNVFGVQFHPEKSSKPGFQLIRNFLAL